MEVGAVKQAFNNEVILLKKKLIQAKIQIIHKLTRRAKTLADKKGPNEIKEKYKRKAESAVNEVLIIKKIKPKDLAKFAITHKENLDSYLNKPIVDQDKACARLLLHKALQDKYKLFRTRFSSIPIKDLFMSREERRKLKKEAREKQKNKKKDKGNANQVVNSKGNWDVEDIETSQKTKIVNDDSDDSASDMEGDKPDHEKDDSHFSKSHYSSANEEEDISDNDQHVSDDGSDSDKGLNTTKSCSDSDNESLSSLGASKNISGQFVKPIECVNENRITNVISKKLKPVEIQKQTNILSAKKANNKSKQSKNKNLNEKLLSRKFKKDANEDIIQKADKIVDPFFITSTGENYMSIVEPRGPDEIKEVHKQGNRKLRRAAMFGHVPKIKPRHDTFRAEDNRYNKQNGFNRNNTTNTFNGRNNFNNEGGNFTNNKRNKFNSTQEDAKPEKLHPSWEAKKKQSGILPFQGKKIVFDES